MDTREAVRPSVLRLTGVACAVLVASGAAGPSDSAVRRDAATPSEQSAGAQALAVWNVITLRTTAAGPFSPPRETRALAMVSAAVFDAVSSITGRYEPYAVRVAVEPRASADAAVGAAAHDVLVWLYPEQRAELDATLDSALTRIPSARAREAGVKAGRMVAAAVLAMRANDRAGDQAIHTPGTEPGAWVPTPPVFAAALEAGWGNVVPFLMDSSSQFRPGPPPRVESERYERDYAEIVNVGGANSVTRTAVQTEVARFWVSTAPQLWNQVVRQLTLARGLDVGTAARAYLIVNLAGADAMIAAWDAKYAYGQWRPITAIRSARGGGLTTDSAWTPAITTPPFPDYPAGHTAYAGAAERVVSTLFGERPGTISISAAGATRRYETVAEIAEEVVNARVWGGVHWRTSSEAGRELGRTIGALALSRAPRRVEDPRSFSAGARWQRTARR
jgi:hypothetical protein